MHLLSAFGGGLWTIPVGLFGAAIFFAWKGRTKSTYYYIFSAACVVAAIVIALIMRSDR